MTKRTFASRVFLPRVFLGGALAGSSTPVIAKVGCVKAMAVYQSGVSPEGAAMAVYQSGVSPDGTARVQLGTYQSGMVAGQGACRD